MSCRYHGLRSMITRAHTLEAGPLSRLELLRERSVQNVLPLLLLHHPGRCRMQRAGAATQRRCNLSVDRLSSPNEFSACCYGKRWL